jgi:geranylgeranyl pyrophosphate synthase
VNLERLLAEERAAIEAALDRLVPREGVWPDRLHRAMAAAVFAGGKRIRPILARLAHTVAGGDADDIVEAACGLELIHTYSLVHDDLPAMDDDVLRRGQPTIHVAFDEATAILAGDALLTEGLLLLASYPNGEMWAPLRAKTTALVAEAISARGMVGGQMEDMEAAQQVSAESADAETRLDRIHRHKTGCLLRASVETGAVLAGLGEPELAPFTNFGSTLGLAFQVADDILDVTASASDLGKSPGKDDAAGKLTYVSLYGLDSARHRLAELENELVNEAQRIEGPDGALAAIARFVCRRTK